MRKRWNENLALTWGSVVPSFPLQMESLGDRQSWRKRLKHVASLHLRQIPCLHAVVRSLRCFKRSRYRSLGQEDGEEEVLDQQQQVNFTFGQVAPLVCSKPDHLEVEEVAVRAEGELEVAIHPLSSVGDLCSW
ncbi:hypothetical protein AK812_SmicGene30728 [Symbiodinium microadriaticum]|uniref:Uncharacterized protein n=1 Tax=Symbiodinium microadriaticum TaxID=2951 RepID=A0A1Q9CYH9_SYMMI|nr:hypothetical protein AK812_SmicGene30728 [Symbiodinium microadriaticum]